MMRLASLIVVSCIVTGCAVPKFEHIRTEKQSIETRAIDAAAEVEPLTRIDLTTFNGAIDVKPHDSDRVSLEVTYKAYGDTEEQAKQNAELLKCEYAIDAGVLSIKAIKPQDQWLAAAAFQVLVPRNCELHLTTSNGTIDASEISAGVDANTSNGSITLTAIAGDINAKTSNGRVSIVNSQGAVQIKTSNGKINYSGQLVGKDNQIQTSNGTVSIKLDAEHSVDIEASTSNGKISCSLPTQKIFEEGKKRYHAIVGDGQVGEVAELSVKTSNGSVTIEETDAKDANDVSAAPQAEVEDAIVL
jgi:DUF4097 and DUF4098 domain-containing protein YvlB